ncbi:MAG TPA: FAD-dependent oxidoreductase [Mesorhizobium sp.]
MGAGIAGLTAATELKRRGLPVIVFEAGKGIGGLASSFKDKDGFAYDFGAHFVSNRLASLLGARNICRTVKHYGEAVHVDGRSYGYPFGLMSVPRFAAGALRERFGERPPMRTAGDWFRRKYGEALAREVAIPLTEAWSGADVDDLALTVGHKFGPRILKALYLGAAAKITRRAVCNGYSHEMPESSDVYHVYPEGGISKLLEPMAKQAADFIRLESPVEGILTDGDRVEAVRVDGREVPVSAVISTAPVNILPRIVKGTSALDRMAKFRYRPMIFVNLHFEGRGILPDTMLWVPDRSKCFFRMTETPISMPWLAPEGKTLITFDIGCEMSDAHWTMSDEDLAKLCLAGISDIFPKAGSSFIRAGGVVRTPVSYPVYLQEYEDIRRQFAASTGVDGLYSIGRNGEFAHILMEDVYWRTLRRCADVAAYVEGGRQRIDDSVELAPSALDPLPELAEEQKHAAA